MNFSDEELMVLFAAGTVSAFDMLYERYRHRIYGFAATCLGSPADAEDAVQDTFLRVARSAAQYQPRDRFRAWLFQIAANRIRDIGARRIRERHGRQNVLVLAAHLESPGDRSCQVRRLEAGDAVQRLLGGIPAEERLLLILRELEGMDMKTIGSVMGMSPENVRVKLHRTRKKLRETLQREGGEQS